MNLLPPATSKPCLSLSHEIQTMSRAPRFSLDLASLARRRMLAALAVLLPAGLGFAGVLDGASPGTAPEAQFLPVGEAFRTRWVWSEGAVVGEFTVAPGYYLYRERLHIQVHKPDGAVPGALELPEGELKDDPYLGRSLEIYHHSFSARLPVRLPDGARGTLEIEAVGQGCAEAGLCYPPVRRTFMLER